MTKSKQYHRLSLEDINWALRDTNLNKEERISLLKAKNKLLNRRISL